MSSTEEKKKMKRSLAIHRPAGFAAGKNFNLVWTVDAETAREVYTVLELPQYYRLLRQITFNKDSIKDSTRWRDLQAETSFYFHKTFISSVPPPPWALKFEDEMTAKNERFCEKSFFLRI